MTPLPTPPALFTWPPGLGPGDLIAVAAPASPVELSACRAGVRLLEEQGYRVRWDDHILKDRNWGRDHDLGLARRFQELWTDPEVKAVLGARGGYGSLKVLPHLDLEVLKANPKRLIGFSDLTNLLWDLHCRLGLVTFHGPNLAQLPHLTPAARDNFFVRLAASGPQALAYQGLTVLHPGAGEGPVAGGNLTTLCHLLGTPYAPRFRGYLVFLEDHNEALYRLDRLMHHLLLAGALDGAAGILLGAFTASGSDSPAQVWEVLGLALKPLGLPVLAGLPVGHRADNHTFPLGAPARLESASASLTFLSAAS